MSVRDRLRDLWPHDDSPGFTDHPRADIRTHRWIARTNRWLSLVVFFVGGWYASRSSIDIALVVALAALIYAAALGAQLQALRWEMQLEMEAGS